MKCTTHGCNGDVIEHKYIKNRCKSCISIISFILGPRHSKNLEKPA